MSKYIDELMAMAKFAEDHGDRALADDCRRTASYLLDYLAYINRAEAAT